MVSFLALVWYVMPLKEMKNGILTPANYKKAKQS